MAMRKQSHTELTLKHRIKLIKAADSRPKPTKGDLMKRFRIGRSKVSDILKLTPNQSMILRTDWIIFGQKLDMDIIRSQWPIN